MEKTPTRPLFEGTEDELKELLDREARRFNTPDFIDADPVQFPRKFQSLPDIEIVSLLASTVAWGNRKMICSNITKMLTLMDWSPAAWLLDKVYEELPDMNIHRTFFARDLRAFMRGLYPIYRDHGSLQEFARKKNIGDTEYPRTRAASPQCQRPPFGRGADRHPPPFQSLRSRHLRLRPLLPRPPLQQPTTITEKPPTAMMKIGQLP